MRTRFFCTYFDHNYIARGLALHDSILQHCPGSKLLILCLSEECRKILKKMLLKNVQLISLDEVEAYEPRLLDAKQNRNIVEYFFTLSPILPLFIFKKFGYIDTITYLDSDTYFFNSPEAIFDEIGDSSVAVVGHRFPNRLRRLERTGKYNVAWLTYSNTVNGLKCLEWYRERCLDWCKDVVEKHRYADQKYLDFFNDIISDVHIIEHKGCNLAPWNIDNIEIVSSIKNVVLVDDKPLILFHFEGLKKVASNKYDSGFHKYQTKMMEVVKQMIYIPYIKKLESKHLLAQNYYSSLKLQTLRIENRSMIFLPKHVIKLFKIFKWNIVTRYFDTFILTES